jgi:SAM-dependent methyltransferase
MLNKGTDFNCPFCNYSSKKTTKFTKIKPVLERYQIVGDFQGYRCMKCNGKAGERLLYVLIRDFFGVFSPQANEKKLLHIAPEKNLTKLLLKANLKEYAVGSLHDEGYYYEDYVQNIDITNIHQYEDEHFDFIVCCHVLEHVPDDLKAMKELRRVLKTGGKAILQVPISKNLADTYEDFSIKGRKEKDKAFGQWNHVRVYGQDYVQRLEEAGFKVERFNLYEKYPKMGLNPDEDVFMAVK